MLKTNFFILAQVSKNLTFAFCSIIIVSINELDKSRRIKVIASLVDGNSIRETVCLTGVAENTIVKLFEVTVATCADHQDKAFNNPTCKRIHCDEIWSFVGAKAKNVPAEKQNEFGNGDVWTWVAIDADTKLVSCWHVGKRDDRAAYEFIHDLVGRLKTRVPLTNDGHRTY